MIRFVVISSLLVAGCEVGEVPGVVTPDGNNGGGGDGSGSGNGCVDTVTPAAAPHSHATGGTSNKGQVCGMSGCHAAGGGGPMFTLSGTVFTDSAGTTAKPGATIKVEFGGTTVTAVSDMDGNFYGTQTITFPAKTLGTACPTVAPMVGMVTAGGGNCNNCHRTGGAASPMYVQ
jgi:hypothetical protein